MWFDRVSVGGHSIPIWSPDLGKNISQKKFNTCTILSGYSVFTDRLTLEKVNDPSNVSPINGHPYYPNHPLYGLCFELGESSGIRPYWFHGFEISAKMAASTKFEKELKKISSTKEFNLHRFCSQLKIFFYSNFFYIFFKLCYRELNWLIQKPHW